jgi:hypothetical protein
VVVVVTVAVAGFLDVAEGLAVTDGPDGDVLVPGVAGAQLASIKQIDNKMAIFFIRVS